MTDAYKVQKLENNKDIIVNVPGSKKHNQQSINVSCIV